MKYIVHYWRANLADATGLEHGSEVTIEQVTELIEGQKVNVMIHHVTAKGDNPAASYCYIDDLNHRFQPRVR